VASLSEINENEKFIFASFSQVFNQKDNADALEQFLNIQEEQFLKHSEVKDP
jgi:hypothetical protein